jgi:dCMP deaminase
MKEKFISAYMDVATRFSQLSSAVRLKVGAIVVKDNRIVSIGYNGTPAGWDNTCENLVASYDQRDTYFRPSATYNTETKKYQWLETKPEVLHAERNAIDKLAKCNEGGAGSVMFVTHNPCLECAKSIYGAGIAQVYYKTDYRNTDGIDFLRRCGVEVEKTC